MYELTTILLQRKLNYIQSTHPIYVQSQIKLQDHYVSYRLHTLVQ